MLEIIYLNFKPKLESPVKSDSSTIKHACLSSVGLNINTSQSNAFLVDLIMKKKKDTGTLFKFETSIFNDVNTLNSKCSNRNDLICSSNCVFIINLLRIFPPTHQI